MTLTAAARPVVSFVPRYTTPMAPEPRTDSIRNEPSFSPINPSGSLMIATTPFAILANSPSTDYRIREEMPRNDLPHEGRIRRNSLI